MRGTALLVGNPTYSLGQKEHVAAVREVREVREVSRRASFAETAALKETDFVSLPGTAKEVQAIDSLLRKKQWNTELLTEARALEENIKAFKKPSLLHIATHGFFLPSDNLESSSNDTSTQRTFTPLPLKEVYEESGLQTLLQSGVVLAGVNSRADTLYQGIEDGILTAYEVVSMDLSNTSLVVLSACETGLGEVRLGEGVFGLQRSLKVAGVKDIAMSLWTVDDEATKQLMIAFYRNWLEYGDKQRAFKEAQLLIRESFPEPYYWGAFVLVGE